MTATRRHIPIAPKPGDDIHAVSHLSAGCGLVKGLPLSMLTGPVEVVEEAPKTIDVIILIRHDGTTEESPVHFTDKCSDPVIATFSAMPHRTVGGGTRQMIGAACTTCGESL